MSDYIGALAEQTGFSAASGLIGGTLGEIFGGLDDRRQVSQQHRLTDIQLDAQKNMMDYGYQKQMDMWNATNYPAQMQQLEKAGLNPGLMYAKGGPGGVTGTPTGSVTGATAQQNPGEIMQAMGIANQNTLLESQKKLMDAQARNIDADTANKPKVGANIESSTLLNLANTENAQANTQLQKVQTEIADIDKQLRGATLADQIQLVGQTVEKTAAEITQIGLNNKLNQQTLEAKVKMATAQLLGQYLQNNLTKAETTQSQAQTKELGARATSELAQGHAALQNAITLIDQVWGTSNDGKTIQEHWNAIQKNYTEKLINLGIGAEAIQGIGQILDHIPALNMMKGIPRGTTPPPVQGFRPNY